MKLLKKNKRRNIAIDMNDINRRNDRNIETYDNRYSEFDEYADYPLIRAHSPLVPEKTTMKLRAHTFDPKVIVKAKIPDIFISLIALTKMWSYIDIESREIGWLGTVERNEDSYIIKDVFLFNQEVSATTTEIQEDGLASFTVETMKQHSREEGMKIMNSLRFWGHSHVTMGTSPSGQDETQLDNFMKDCDWFIRGIGNKHGRLEFTIYDNLQGIVFKDVPWTEEMVAYPDIRESIRAEIEQKVKSRTYVYHGRDHGSVGYKSIRYCPVCKEYKQHWESKYEWRNGEAHYICPKCNAELLTSEAEIEKHKNKSIEVANNVNLITKTYEHRCNTAEPLLTYSENELLYNCDRNNRYLYCPICGVLIATKDSNDDSKTMDYSKWTTDFDIEILRNTYKRQHETVK